MGKIKAFLQKDFLNLKLSYTLSDDYDFYIDGYDFYKDDYDCDFDCYEYQGDILFDCEFGLFSFSTSFKEIEDGMDKKVLFDKKISIGGLCRILFLSNFLVYLACNVSGYSIFTYGVTRSYILSLITFFMILISKLVLTIVFNVKNND